jgi:hypothetical protein
VWLVFQRKYGGGPPICRHVIDLYDAAVTPPADVPTIVLKVAGADVQVMGPCV